MAFVLSSCTPVSPLLYYYMCRPGVSIIFPLLPFLLFLILLIPQIYSLARGRLPIYRHCCIALLCHTFSWCPPPSCCSLTWFLSYTLQAHDHLLHQPRTLGHSFFICSLTGDFEKKWSRGDEIKIKLEKFVQSIHIFF